MEREAPKYKACGFPRLLRPLSPCTVCPARDSSGDKQPGLTKPSQERPRSCGPGAAPAAEWEAAGPVATHHGSLLSLLPDPRFGATANT